MGIKFEKRKEYSIEYVDDIFNTYKELVKFDESTFEYGRSCRKNKYQRKYEKLNEYKEKLI